jgi:hypothetical protein
MERKVRTEEKLNDALYLEVLEILGVNIGSEATSLQHWHHLLFVS